MINDSLGAFFIHANNSININNLHACRTNINNAIKESRGIKTEIDETIEKLRSHINNIQYEPKSYKFFSSIRNFLNKRQLNSQKRAVENKIKKFEKQLTRELTKSKTGVLNSVPIANNIAKKFDNLLIDSRVAKMITQINENIQIETDKIDNKKIYASLAFRAGQMLTHINLSAGNLNITDESLKKQKVENLIKKISISTLEAKLKEETDKALN